NPQAAAVLAAQLAELPVTGTCHAVVGMLRDKAIPEVLTVLAPRIDQWHLLDLSATPRGATAVQLQAVLPSGARERAECWSEIDTRLARLDESVGPDDLVLVFGSFVTVGRVRQWLATTSVGWVE
ncbi:MAG: hypothetical protein D6720_05315, partial [Gammaproteobacteria bacterium]